MAEKYLTEAFQALELLEEDVFDVTDDGIAKAQEFINDSELDELETIIDPLATSEEELQDSYLGKVILDCTICQSKIYKDAEEVTIDEEVALANVGEICPYCQSSDGYKVIGQVAPYQEETETEVTTDDENAEVDVEEKPEEDTIEEACEGKDCEDEEELDEAIASKKGKKKLASMKEDLNNVQIETDNERITVTSEPKEEEIPATDDEMIAPIEPDVEARFNSEEPITDEETAEPEFQDIDIDEFEEDSFDELGEKYLKRVYENVASYKTTSGAVKGNTLKLEGIITFKSGKQSKTNFVFESHKVTKTGKVKFTGLNEQFAKGRKTFTLTGSVDKSKLLPESLTYNYRAKDTTTGKTSKLYGRVSTRK